MVVYIAYTRTLSRNLRCWVIARMNGCRAQGMKSKAIHYVLRRCGCGGDDATCNSLSDEASTRSIDAGTVKPSSATSGPESRGDLDAHGLSGSEEDSVTAGTPHDVAARCRVLCGRPIDIEDPEAGICMNQCGLGLNHPGDRHIFDCQHTLPPPMPVRPVPADGGQLGGAYPRGDGGRRPGPGCPGAW